MSKDKQQENPTQASNDNPKPATELSEKDLKQVTGGAVNAYLQIGDIKGESQDKGHKDWIEI